MFPHAASGGVALDAKGVAPVFVKGAASACTG
jgi:hypothetical protein